MQIKKILLAILLFFAPCAAQAEDLMALNTASFSNYLNASGYSQQLGQIKNITSQYQGYMSQYQNYSKQYDNLVQQYKSMGSPASLQGEYMAKAQSLVSGATSSYANASKLTGSINGMTSGLQGQLTSKLNVNNSLGQLRAAASSITGVMGQLNSVSGQLNSLKSATSGNYAAALQISGMQNYVGQIQSQLGGLQSSLGSAASNYANGMGANVNFNAISGQLSSVTGMVGNLQSQLGGMTTGALSGATAGLSKSLGAVTGAIGGISGQVTGAVSGLTGSVGNMLGGSLNSITGMGGGGMGSFGGNSKSGNTGGGSGSGSGQSGNTGGSQSGGANLSMPAMKGFNVAGDFAASNSQNSATTEEEKVEEDFEGFIPNNDPDAYWTKESEGKNAMFTSDDIRSDGQSNSPITINGEGTNAAYRFGGGEDAAQYLPKLTKKLDAKSSYKGTAVGYEFKGNDGKSAAKTMGEYYEGLMELPQVPINNWGKAAGTNLLIPWTPTQKAPEGFGADGYFTQEGRKNVFNASTGKKKESYNTTYKDNEDALKNGACQMIAVKSGGAYTAIPAANGTFELAEKGTKGALSMVPERIIDASHPYAPRNKEDWKERPLSSKTNYRNTTEICGKEELIGNKKAWEQISDNEMSGSFDTGDMMSALNDKGINHSGLMENYEYYKLPLDKKGKILATPERKELYEKIYKAIYKACTAITGSSEACDKAAKLAGCRIAILPPEKPTNYLKMSYNKQDAGSEMPWIYSIDGDDFAYDDTVRDELKGVTSLEKYFGLGTSWHQILPHENFGYNMPPLLHWPTGKPASRPIIEKTDPYPGKESKEGWETKEWEYWRTTITGVNSRFKPDESNPEEIGVQNFGAMHGEWNELVAYQANCNRYFGLNCICDYYKNFYRGTAMGYALARSSGQLAIGNEAKNQVTKVQFENLQDEYSKYNYKQQTTYNKNTDISDVKTWERILNTKQANQNFPAIIGKKMASSAGGKKDANWPGKGNYLAQGLDNAVVGDIIVWDSQKDLDSSGHKRPLHAAYVEKVIKDAAGSPCVEISESNNGVIRDAAEITENWGRVTQRTLCKADDQGYTYMQDGKKGLQDCANNQLIKCWEKQWNDWKVYKYDLDKDRVTDPKTGEVKKAAQCEQWKDEFDKNQEKIKATQSGGWKDKTREDPSTKNPLIQTNYDLLHKGTQYGCNPNKKWNVPYRDNRAGSVTNAQFTPQAPGESPAMFDFINNIRLGSSEKKYSNMPKPQMPKDPPKITFPHNPGAPLAPKKTCGQKAVAFASGIKNTAGIAYKNDCAGNIPAPNSGASCNGKEYGHFGLIYAAYNNSAQTENIDGFWNTSPANASGAGEAVLAYKNYHENLVKEPNGCRITNLSACAKAGDIVLVQYGNGLNRFSNYNRWLIYDGSSKFFEVQETGQVVRYGSLPPEYTSISYEVRRPACNNLN